MLPIFQVLQDCRPTVKYIFSKSPPTKDPEELKAYFDKVGEFLKEYWDAERAFTGSMDFNILIPCRYYFSREAADKLISLAYLATDKGFIPLGDARKLEAAIIEQRRK